jgi:hypothetical protein
MSARKHHHTIWLAAIGLGAMAGTAVADPVTNPDFVTGNTLTADHMNEIKTSVNDNDARITTNSSNITTLNGTVTGHTTSITTLNSDVTNLKGNFANGACVGNNTLDIMVRVGSLCVDKYQVGLYNGTTDTATAATACADTEGKTGCTEVAQSRASGTRATAVDVSWALAARACANAGKHLLTPAEWVTAWQNSNISDMVAGATPGTGTSEWVNSMAAPAAAGKTEGGFIGQNFDAGGSVFVLEYGTSAYDLTNSGWSHVRFRCAR